ncbi:ATP-dependent DNA helicase RecQ [Roseiconus nitratireducens]|uniref:ATP-dependent DNA helicase RecQ n=1 Tax=Roseiconus nitratireducens TaxID=2605748 RepID=A0A5M6DIJ2_9BACT|nr:ATP-dependent DNA helicase RecQ [Roseiconus nitratireducens]KAA5546050.1 ATP-dependent DNA helicase RecQ [Roseiconus nitratireducens]
MNARQTDPESLLSRFGLSRFRPGQLDVIEAVGRGEDVMCVMPTGGGKSLCYQLPTLARDGTTIVVSPLIALMKDQVDSLQRLGIEAKLINSTQGLREQEDVMEEMRRGSLQLVYVAPERLRNGRFLECLEQSHVTLLAVDEAHCVSEWGHDFRPDYARLGQVRRRYLNGLQTIALTATATPAVRDDVCDLLGLSDPKVFVTGFARTNLHLGVAQSKTDSEKEQQLIEYVQQQEGAGIIYAATRRACEAVGDWLPEKTRRPIGVYHGGMDPMQRKSVQEKFMEGKLSAIVATNAFGMGIDKADIRFVAHYNMPGTLEAYYQEAGRAGRDGQPSDCRLFFSYQDRYIQEFFIENRYPSRETVQKVYEYLLSRTEDPIELTLEQVREGISADSSESIGTAETLLAKTGVLRRLDSGQNQMIVRLDTDEASLQEFLPREAKLRRRVMQAVEKVIGRRRHDDVFVTPRRLMELADVQRDQLMRTLRELSRLNAFDYVPPFRGRAIHFVRRDMKFDDLEIDFDELARRKASEYAKLESVIGFARSSGCRQRVILDYFGDPDSRDCGNCDRCGTDQATADGRAAMTAGLSESDARSLVCGIRVVLSGVTRMHGRFGKNLVAQMLCGSQNKRMSQWKLQRLSTYGMLSSMKQSQLVKVIDALIEAGLVDQREVDQRRPTIAINDVGKQVMHLKTEIPGSLQLSKSLARSLALAARGIESSDVSRGDDDARSRGAEESVSHSDPDGAPERPAAEAESDSVPEAAATDEPISVTLDALTDPEQKLVKEIRETLRRWRRRISAALGVPAFRVLTNSTIDRLAELRPESSTALEDVSGIGPATMEQHGYDILEMIRECVSAAAIGDDPAAQDSPAAAQDSPAAAARNSTNGREQAGSGPTVFQELSTVPATDVPETDVPETDVTDTEQDARESSLRTDRPLGDTGPIDPTDHSARSDAGHPMPPPVESAVANQPDSQDDSVATRDSYWTWRLFSEGFTMQEVCQIRRLSRREVSRQLKEAANQGRQVSASWHN